jgi:predicted naringenin-chalcone synthase
MTLLKLVLIVSIISGTASAAQSSRERERNVVPMIGSGVATVVTAAGGLKVKSNANKAIERINTSMSSSYVTPSSDARLAKQLRRVKISRINGNLLLVLAAMAGLTTVASAETPNPAVEIIEVLPEASLNENTNPQIQVMESADNSASQ